MYELMHAYYIMYVYVRLSRNAYWYVCINAFNVRTTIENRGTHTHTHTQMHVHTRTHMYTHMYVIDHLVHIRIGAK